MHGSIRWMAPELLHPTQTGREHGRATAETDVYAFAMLMLEVRTHIYALHGASSPLM